MLIDIISPAGAHLDLVAFDRGCERLANMGHKLNVRAPREGWQRFGADDATRLQMIHDAAAGAADMVMLTRGGYGLSRLLDHIDWSLVATAVRRGQKWVGFSDFTAFQAALFSLTGASSYAGPTVAADFGAGELNPSMEESFRTLAAGRLPLITWKPGDAARPEHRASELSIEGRLWGGNLSMLTSLVGSAYMPTLKAPSFLWIEDVAEHPYRVERMMHQLFYAGVLQKQKAILLGSFNQWKPATHDHGYDLAEMISYLRKKLNESCGANAPLWLDGLPFGHQALKTIIGFGHPYALSCTGDKAQLLPL